MATLQPWNIRISQVGPPALPPLSSLKKPPILPVREPHPKYPFENLAFEGGGAKGIAYVGAITVLEEVGLYPTHIRRVAGTSSGSFLAAMLAVGTPASELHRLLFETDIASVMRDARFGLLSGVVNMVTLYGWNPGSKLLSFLGEQLRARTGSEDVTFKQLHERCGRELCVPVTNLTRMCTEYCHPKTTPDMPVRLAVGMSMSLPVLMVPYRIVRTVGGGDEADLYTDGGLLCNYPIHAFDGWWLSLSPEDTYLKRLRPPERVREMTHDSVRFQPRNPRTLGLTVFDRTELDASEWWVPADGAPPERPSSPLAKARAEGEAKLKKRHEMHDILDRSSDRLVEAMSRVETSGDGHVSREEILKLFDTGVMSSEDAKILFGTSEIGAIFEALDHNKDGTVAYDELMRFIDGRNVEVTTSSRLGLPSPTSMAAFVSTVFNTLLMHLRRVTLLPEDRFRTVPIDTDYVGTADFDLLQPDRQFLLETGKRAARAFLKKYEG